MPRPAKAVAGGAVKPRKRRRRRGRKPGVKAMAPFLLFVPGRKRKKPKEIAKFGAVRAKVIGLINRGVCPDTIGVYQRRKVGVVVTKKVTI